ncbi:uncharacterized protein LOC144136105 [Amblyomma americanum]
MACSGIDFQSLLWLSDMASQQQQVDAAVTTTAGVFAEADASPCDLISFEPSGDSRDTLAQTSGDARHFSPSAMPPGMESTAQPAQPCSSHAAPQPELPGQANPQEAALRNALRLTESLTGIVQNNLQTPAAVARPRLRVDLPSYGGYHDPVSANEYLDRMLNYQQATGLTDGEVLVRVVPVSLTDQAARWFRLTGHRSRTMEEFRARFREKFLPADYDRRLRRELELRTQHPDETLLEYVRAMDELYRIADPSAQNGEKVERVTRQAHPTFAAYLRGVQFRDLNDLASADKRIEADILASRAYRPPPPASQVLEPRCAWNGDTFRIRSRGAETVAFSDGQLRNGWELSDRALDPYTYAMRAAHAARSQDVRNDRPKKPLETPSAELPYQPVDRTERKSAKGTPPFPCDPLFPLRWHSAPRRHAGLPTRS